MTLQSVRKIVRFNSEMHWSRVAAQEAARAMLAAARDALLVSDVTRYAEQSDAERAQGDAERRRETMSWEGHAWCADGTATSRRARTR